METVRFSETWLSNHHTTRHSNPRNNEYLRRSWNFESRTRNEKGVMGGMCSTHGEVRMHTKFFSENLTWRYHGNRCRRKDNIKTKVWICGLDSCVCNYGTVAGLYVHFNEIWSSAKVDNILIGWAIISFSKGDRTQWRAVIAHSV